MAALSDQQSSSLEKTHQYPAHIRPQLLTPTFNSEILEKRCIVQRRVYTPSPSLTLTYTPPPSAKLLQHPASPLPAHLDFHLITSPHPFYSDMDSHVIVRDIAAHPPRDDMDASSIMPAMDAPNMPAHPLHADMVTPVIPTQPLHADMDTHISTPVIPAHPLHVDLDTHVITHLHANVNAHIIMPTHLLDADMDGPALADVDANIITEKMPPLQPSLASNSIVFDHYDPNSNDAVNSQSIDLNNDAYNPLHESHLFTIWANGFDPISPHDIVPGDISPNHHNQFNHIHFIELAAAS